ncbi:hypothetical protein F5Y15DRAFT_364069 [Xylariaceae sp. FL0016]|nr:hypothetical protein F5Y15DRAFT_364069 [Xylariaceae sp. FL0016]
MLKIHQGYFFFFLSIFPAVNANDYRSWVQSMLLFGAELQLPAGSSTVQTPNLSLIKYTNQGHGRGGLSVQSHLPPE